MATLFLYTFGLVYLLWVFYIADMHLIKEYRAKTLSKTAIVFGVPLMIAGGLLDIFLNVTLATVAFWDIPKELTLSQRLSRYVETMPGTKRAAVANWFGATLLNTFDPSGKHIGK